MSFRKKKPVQFLSLDQATAKHGWVFALPVLLGFVLIFGPIIVQSFLFSFSDIKPGINSFEQTWVGLTHYNEALFVNNDYVRNLVNTVLNLMYQVPLIVIFSLFIASMLSKKLPGRTAFRTIFFIPAVLVTGAIADSFNGNLLLNTMNGLAGIDTGASTGLNFNLQEIQTLLGGDFLSDNISNFILNAVNNVSSLVNQCGVQILVFICGLYSISPSVYEAASIEGANGWDCYWKITVPMLKPMVFVNIIYSIVDSFTNSSNVIMRQVYDKGIKESKIGYASAMSWMYFAIIFVILLLVMLVMRNQLNGDHDNK